MSHRFLRAVPDPDDTRNRPQPPERVNGHGVLVDVDGDGVPDAVTPAAGRGGVELERRAPTDVAEVVDDEPALPVDPPDLPRSLEQLTESMQRARLEPVLPE